MPDRRDRYDEGVCARGVGGTFAAQQPRSLYRGAFGRPWLSVVGEARWLFLARVGVP